MQNNETHQTRNNRIHMQHNNHHNHRAAKEITHIHIRTHTMNKMYKFWVKPI